MGALPGWRCQAVVYNLLSRVAPGIEEKIREQEIEVITIDHENHLEQKLPSVATVLALGAVFESFAMDLFIWAKQREIAVIAIQEVAQLALNQNDINNYDAPFDRLFVASQAERQRFLDIGYPSQMLSISGLLANERYQGQQIDDGNKILQRIGITDGKKPIVYTTSPLRTRLALHNKDNLRFREAVLTELATASARTGRRVVIKLHPNEDVETERPRIRRIVADAIVLGREFNMDELFAATGILVNRGNSQTCLEATFRGVPTVVAACGLKTLFHSDGGAYVVDKKSDICEAIEQADKHGCPDNSRVKANHFFLPPNGVAGFIAMELAALVDKPRPVNEADRNWLIKSMLFVGRQDRALQCLETLDSRTSWQDGVRMGLVAHRESRLQDAIAGWHTVIGLDPNWYFPHYELAHGHHATGEYHQAIDHAHKAMELHPPFHTLWHEIPMRVVIMASLRSMGNIGAAIEELNSLEARGLVDNVPELLIEKAAQLGSVKGRLEDASCCLDNALNQLKTYPVNESADGQIRDRALSQVAKLIEQCEQKRAYPVAERLCLRTLEVQPDDLWSKYRLARARLMQGKLSKALHDLHSITRMPNGPRRIFDRILSPSATEKFDQYWPATPRSVLRPIKLAVLVSAWAIAKVIRSGFKEFADAATASLLIAVFVVRHFFRKLRSEIVALRRTLRMLRF